VLPAASALVLCCADPHPGTGPNGIALEAEVIWQQNIGGPGWESGFSIAPSNSGGIVLACGSTIFGGGGNDIYLIEIDQNGDTAWTRTLGTPFNELGYKIIKTLDGGYAIAGTATSGPTGNNDFMLMKVGADGNMQWMNTYGDSYNQSCNSVAQAPDGGFVMAGLISSPAHPLSDVCVIKTDASGDSIWYNTFSYIPLNSDAARDIIGLPDGTYYVIGKTDLGQNTSTDLYVIKIDDHGEAIWEMAVDDHMGSNWGERAVLNDDLSLTVAGWGSNAGRQYDPYMAIITNDGTVRWQEYYGARQSDGAGGVTALSAGGFALVGFIGQVPAGSSCYVARTDPRGHLLWETEIGLGLASCGNDILEALDGSLFILGYSDIVIGDVYQRDVFIARLIEVQR
jgi:hypothetical protein